MTTGKCRHGEFELLAGCEKCIAEVQAGREALKAKLATKKETVSVLETDDFFIQTDSEPLALIPFNPDADSLQLYQEGIKLLNFAQARTITKNEDLKPATEDLSIIAKLKKALTEKKNDYLNPFKEHVKQVNDAFAGLLSPFEEADKINRDMIKIFKQEQDRRAAEAARIEAEKLKLAREEAELNGTGEITIPLGTAVAPPVVPAHTYTGMGSQGFMKIPKWEVVDFAAVPDDYKIIDAGKVTKLVKAGIGAIAGIRIWIEDTVRINTR